jgi:aconitate hydratase
VLSGNRNFEGRINPDVKMNYLASPPLVVAYALAGTMDVDLLDEPLGQDADGNDVFLNDIWPSSEEVGRVVEDAVRSEMFQKSYGEVFEGGPEWNALEVPEGDRYAWAEDSTYVRRPSFLENVPREPEPQGDIEGARVLALLGDSVTTDHISPAGSIKKGSPAALYLNEHGVEQSEFNSYGARRGNHEVMVRGTFANIRLRNLLAGRDDLVGGLTLKLPEGDQMPIYDAAMRYAEEGTPLVVLAGKEYGSGSSRDWAAKGTNLLGVRAVIAQSFERIHRSNLVGMGVLPLQFADGESAESLGLTGEEEFSITGVENGDAKQVTVRAGDKEFTARVRIDTPKEVQYYQHGGILPFVLRNLLERSSSAEA